jgi:hypothetical protein
MLLATSLHRWIHAAQPSRAWGGLERRQTVTPPIRAKLLHRSTPHTIHHSNELSVAPRLADHVQSSCSGIWHRPRAILPVYSSRPRACWRWGYIWRAHWHSATPDHPQRKKPRNLYPQQPEHAPVLFRAVRGLTGAGAIYRQRKRSKSSSRWKNTALTQSAGASKIKGSDFVW